MLQDQLNQYLDANRLYRWEGDDVSVANMEKVIQEVCGYGREWNGTLHNFFADNPGAVEAVLEWISTARVKEWEDNLTSLGFDGEEDSEWDDARELSVGD